MHNKNLLLVLDIAAGEDLLILDSLTCAVS